MEVETNETNHQNCNEVNLSSQKIDYIKCDSQVFIEDNQHIEMEEWIAFLQHSMQEVISGELALLMHTNQLNVLVKLLRNPISNATIISYVLKLLSIPFASTKISKENLSQIRKTYVEIKLVPNLLYAVKLIFRKYWGASLADSTSPINTPTPESSIELSSDDFQSLESIFLLICYLVHQSDDYFLLQFCDAVVVLGVYKLINCLLILSPKHDSSTVSDILAILSHLLKRFPDNISAVEKILSSGSDKHVNFVDLLRNADARLRQRSCYFIYFVAMTSDSIIGAVWSSLLKETLEALMYDSIEAVRIAAELTVNELKTKDFYNSLDG